MIKINTPKIEKLKPTIIEENAGLRNPFEDIPGLNTEERDKLFQLGYTLEDLPEYFQNREMGIKIKRERGL